LGKQQQLLGQLLLHTAALLRVLLLLRLALRVSAQLPGMSLPAVMLPRMVLQPVGSRTGQVLGSQPVQPERPRMD
jgi:hypothetical protein